MKRYRQRGFSLLELLIVMAIIFTLSAMTIPSLLRARQNAYEASAAATLHTVQTSQIAYRAANGSYADSFDKLPEFSNASVAANSPDPQAPSAAGSRGPGAGSPSGNTSSAVTEGGATSMIIRANYIFTLTKRSDEEWSGSAEPALERVFGKYFYTDETGVVRSDTGHMPVVRRGSME